MRTLKLLTLLIFVSATAVAQQKWAIDPSHSKMGFKITHMKISEVSGQFNKFEGWAKTKNGSFDGADVQVTIKANSIDTDHEKRDGHLRSKDFFYVEKHPEIKFESSKLKKVKGDKYKLVGDLTMRGVTKEVTLDAKHQGTVTNPMSGKETAGFAVNGSIDRTDYGINWNKTLDSGGVLVGKEVKLDISVELVKQ